MQLILILLRYPKSIILLLIWNLHIMYLIHIYIYIYIYIYLYINILWCVPILTSSNCSSSTNNERNIKNVFGLSCCSFHPPRLHSLRSLSLHNNLLTYLPREILSLVQLQELSLRGNPLVVRFIKDMTYDPPSLLELAGRTVKSKNLPYSHKDLPSHLVNYLDMASKCPNPKCAGGRRNMI